MEYLSKVENIWLIKVYFQLIIHVLLLYDTSFLIVYIGKVVDETLRVVTFSLMVFREAKKDVNING